jgi:hypothetical protein
MVRLLEKEVLLQLRSTFTLVRATISCLLNQLYLHGLRVIFCECGTLRLDPATTLCGKKVRAGDHRKYKVVMYRI